MKPWCLVIILTLSIYEAKGQAVKEPEEGVVSFISSQNVYVNFKTTQNLTVGDTLYINPGDSMKAVLKVRYLSSISAACIPISTDKINVSDKIFTRKAPIEKAALISSDKPPEIHAVELKKDTVKEGNARVKQVKQEIRGYISAASYVFFSNSGSGNSQRMQYTLSLNARNLAGSKWSTESYITFRHKINEWSGIRKNIFDGLKIYNLAVTYELNKKFNVLLGRKLNPKFSNLGATDGLQFSMNLKPFTIGLIGGSRPDFTDYGFNFRLMQFGGYIYHETTTKNGPLQNTIAFIEQTNSGKTDRRFAYVQHYNSIVPDLSIFGSAEIDLYKKTFVRQDSIVRQDSVYRTGISPKVSSFYFSIRYRAFRKLNLSVSYSARQNIIYYETYKSFVDQLLQSETRQGYYFQANFRPVNKLILGVNAGYNFQKNDAVKSRNLNAYLTYSQIPWFNVSTTLSSTFLETNYFSGKIYRIDFSRDIIPGKLYGGVNYSYVQYLFNYAESNLPQHIGEMNISWRIYRKLTCSLYFESTFEKNNRYNRAYIQLNNRF